MKTYTVSQVRALCEQAWTCGLNEMYSRAFNEWLDQNVGKVKL